MLAAALVGGGVALYARPAGGRRPAAAGFAAAATGASESIDIPMVLHSQKDKRSPPMVASLATSEGGKRPDGQRHANSGDD